MIGSAIGDHVRSRFAITKEGPGFLRFLAGDRELKLEVVEARGRSMLVFMINVGERGQVAGWRILAENARLAVGTLAVQQDAILLRRLEAELVGPAALDRIVAGLVREAGQIQRRWRQASIVNRGQVLAMWAA